ncbi:P1 family peptidase [Cohaesibacter celericrescens]|uniref:P1 family peptidase n=1 Tax=Cohaesibacter celericrescens TaxID=2067669 RepID=UPI003568E94A
MTLPIRIRDLGVEPGFLPTGRLNAITDVPGVKVGHVTIRDGDICTGATSILHCESQDLWLKARFGSSYVLNGYGQVVGRDWLQESGLMNGPLLLTSYFGVSALLQGLNSICPDTAAHGYTHHLVAETWDGWLSDPMSGAIQPIHAAEVIANATSGHVTEGCVGGGTGMSTYDLKAGIGTSSRKVGVAGEQYTLGVLVQSNFGNRRNLMVDGMHLGRQIPHDIVPMPERTQVLPNEDGSIIIVVATDAPLLPQQCEALSRRATLGLARTGAMANNGSGDFAISFSTGNMLDVLSQTPHHDLKAVPAREMNSLFHATVEATEEAILNALCAAETTTGFMRRTVHALPHDLIRKAVSAQKNRS